jgi:hypothetical protein
MPEWFAAKKVTADILRRAAQAMAVTLWLLAFSTGAQADTGIHVISNSQQPVTILSLKELRAMFLMRLRTWPNGETVQVFVLRQEDPVHIQFCKDLLSVYPHQLQAGWDRLVYSGTGAAPVILETEQEMLNTIANTPGSIGYIQEDIPHANVKTITVQ